MPWERTLYFGLVVAIMTFTMNGLAIGLGVLYPNFKEENPSKIVSGFGGTLCLVLSFFYILGSVLLLAFASPGLHTQVPARPLVLLSVAGFSLLSVGLGWLPLKLALRHLPKFEF